MTAIATTLVPGEGRGCGDREEEAIYGCLPPSIAGDPIWDKLLDPPIPYEGDFFRGVQFAPPELTESWDEEAVLLLDWIGKRHYPSVPGFIEEARRFGLSRRFQPGFDFAALAGKRVYLGLIHARAIQRWVVPSIEDVGDELLLEAYRLGWDGVPLPHFDFRHCRKRLGDDAAAHYPECIYHLWPLSLRLHKDTEQFGLIEMPSFVFYAFRVVRLGDQNPVEEWEKYPEVEYGPGLFALFEVAHFEAIGRVPEGTSLGEAGLPVVVMEK